MWRMRVNEKRQAEEKAETERVALRRALERERQLKVCHIREEAAILGRALERERQLGGLCRMR